MLKTKEYYQSLMRVIEYVKEGNTDITCEKCTELSGDYWPQIYRLFKDEHIGVAISGGDFDVTQPQYLSPLYAECQNAIEEIGKREEDRRLANEANATDIKYAHKAYWISIAAIGIAAASLAWQIFTQATS